MLARLDRETRVQRGEAERARPWLLAMPSVRQYSSFLRRTYGLEAPLESAFAITPHLPAIVDLRGRATAGLLATDLLALGVGAGELARLPLCPGVRPFDSLAEALGWMYAHERSAFYLGDLREQLARALPDQIENAGRYLASYQPDLLTVRWRELGEALDQISGSTAVEDRVIGGARAAYRCQHDWFGEELRTERAG